MRPSTSPFFPLWTGTAVPSQQRSLNAYQMALIGIHIHFIQKYQTKSPQTLSRGAFNHSRDNEAPRPPGCQVTAHKHLMIQSFKDILLTDSYFHFHDRWRNRCRRTQLHFGKAAHSAEAASVLKIRGCALLTQPLLR